MDEEENRLSYTQTNDIFEEMVKYLFDVSQTNNIFDNLLTESEIEKIVNDLFDVSQPESDKKDGDDESSITQKRKTVIVHTSNFAQIGAGRVEPEKEKNPQHENQQLQHDSYQVEVENNPIIDKQQDGVIKKGERLKTFKNKLFQITYDPHNADDILKTGKKYKPKIKGKVQEYIGKGVRFFMVYKVKLIKFNIEGEEEIKVNAYLNSGNKRILDMVEFDDVYNEHMLKINEEFENYTGEGSGWIL